MIRRATLATALLIGVTVATAPVAFAQPLPTDRSELAYSYAPLVKRVSPAVNIYTTTTAACAAPAVLPRHADALHAERAEFSRALVRPDG
jgi:serine protease Do